MRNLDRADTRKMVKLDFRRFRRSHYDLKYLMEVVMDYKSIEFGEISADLELEKFPKFVDVGFHDYKNTMNKLLDGVEYYSGLEILNRNDVRLVW